MVRRHLEFKKVEPVPSTRSRFGFMLVANFKAFFLSFRVFFSAGKERKRRVKTKEEPEPQWRNDRKGSGSRG
jgi:hypothetical protein